MSEIPRSRELDKLLASLIFASLVLHFGFVFYLHQMDWPRESEVPDQYWHLLPPRPVFAPPPPKAPIVKAAGGVPGRTTTRHSAPRPTAQVSLVKALGGENGIRELIGTGKDPDEIFAKMGGVSLPVESSGLEIRTHLESANKRDGGPIHVEGPGSVSVGRRGQERLVDTQVIIEPPQSVTGGLPPSVIVAAIRQRLGGIRACYQGPFNHDNGLAGKITLHFSVTPAGVVDEVDIDEDTLHSAEVARCMKLRVAGWRFPPSSRPSAFGFPFIFQGGS